MAALAPACLDRPVALQQPSTSKLSTKLYQNKKVDKIDLLFMIDNSASMADKQKILADAVPDLVNRLTNPVCVDSSGANAESVPSGQPCPNGKVREFDPIKDIHIGVITSSLGGHGADSCSESGQGFTPHQADMSHLITRGKDASGGAIPTVPTWNSKGFLNWDPDGKASPPGESNVGNLISNFTDIVRGADEDGCGFESQLEAWYRFLVDPAPYAQMAPCDCDAAHPNQCRCGTGLDTTVLQQRADMVRQDSLLAVVMLTDENDCSVIDGGQYYLALQALDGTNPFHVPHGTNACQSDPWSPDCQSCWVADPNKFPECATGWQDPAKDDPLNLRCFDQQRRFGLNFLQPIARYVNGLTVQKFGDNTLNPVFCTQFGTAADGSVDLTTCANTMPLRDKSLVFLAGIIGVPWQDIAVDPNDLSKGYRTAKELKTPMSSLANAPAGVPADKTLWDVILGQTRDSDGEIVPTVDPLDPLMKESIDPRTGTNPVTGDALGPTASGPLNNKINGSEWDITSRADLQYACVFPLPTPIPNGGDCPPNNQNPLCFDGSNFGTTQYRAKAYPDRRELAVLKGVGDQAIVASICPAKIDPTQSSAPDWGYRPAIATIIDRLKTALAGTCWDVPLQVDANGQVPCIVLEATKVDGDCPPCDDGSGVRSEASGTAKQVLATDAAYAANKLNCVCQVNQIKDPAALASCQTTDQAIQAGWCYVDQTDQGSDALLAHCPADSKRLIHFVSAGNETVPRTGSLTYLQCKGADLSASAQ